MNKTEDKVERLRLDLGTRIAELVKDYKGKMQDYNWERIKGLQRFNGELNDEEYSFLGMDYNGDKLYFPKDLSVDNGTEITLVSYAKENYCKIGLTPELLVVGATKKEIAQSIRDIFLTVAQDSFAEYLENLVKASLENNPCFNEDKVREFLKNNQKELFNYYLAISEGRTYYHGSSSNIRADLRCRRNSKGYNRENISCLIDKIQARKAEIPVLHGWESLPVNTLTFEVTGEEPYYQDKYMNLKLAFDFGTRFSLISVSQQDGKDILERAKKIAELDDNDLKINSVEHIDMLLEKIK